MKKNVIGTFVLLSLFSFSCVNAQHSLGVSAGFNNSTVKVDDNSFTRFNDLQNWWVGVNSTLISREKWEVRSTLQFSNKGWSEPTNEEEYKYLDFLTMVEYKPLPIFGVYGGFNMGYLLNESTARNNKKFDPGLLLGACVHVDKFNFFAHYNASLVNHQVTSSNDFLPTFTGYNSSFQFGINYKIFNKSNTTKSFFSLPFEIGVSTTNLRDFRVLYKQKLDNGRYARVDLVSNDIRYNNLVNGKKILNYTIGFNLGLESRIDFDKFTFLRGPQAQISISNFNNETQMTPSFGYILGLQYNFASKFSLGFEIVPSVGFYVNDNNFGTSNYDILVSAKNSPRFHFVYHFKR